MLIPKDDFIGLDDVIHLATGGESPVLRSHQEAVNRFFTDKVTGEAGREQMAAVQQACAQKAAQLLAVNADEITFLSHASEGINLIAHALEWEPGDNVVVADVEFPSDVLPWTRLEAQGVEVRIVRHRGWQITLEDIQQQIDDRTRVAAISYVSYYTGQRQDLPALAAAVHESDALLVLDATHAAGAVPVDAYHADIVVSSCYKWLLGVHGAAIFYWNRTRLPDLQPPFLGWNTADSGPEWQAPTFFTPKPDANRFLPGNPSFISLYVLENALEHLLRLGRETIEAHVLQLSGLVWEGLTAQGWEVMTPQAPEHRAGNVCILPPNPEVLCSMLADQKILVWGGSRVRISTHLYNTAEDVSRLLKATHVYASQ